MVSLSRRSLGAALALLAAFLLAFAPTVSRALTEVALPDALCSATGEAHGGGAPASDDSRGNAHLDRCPLCPIAGGGLPPPAARIAVAAIGGAPIAPAPVVATPGTQQSWSQAAPRGPPARA